jgi:parallel beta-helix repeat protein
MPSKAILLLTTLFCGVAHAATYYVAPPASGGSDSNPGTLSQPFATITHGLSILSTGGDTLLVRGGTYAESVTVWHKYGIDDNAPITIQNYNGETAVIDGTGTATNGVVVIDESSYVNFDGFEVKNGPKAGIDIWDADHIKVRWNNVHDCQTNGISAGGDALDQTHDITFDGNTVKFCVLSNSARTATSWQQALSAYKTKNVTFVNNWVHDNYGEGIDSIVSDYGTIANNTVYDNYSVDIYLDNARYTTVDSNFIPSGWSSSPSSYYRNGQPACGICTANEYYSTQRPLTNLTISNNIVVHTKVGFGYGNYEYGGGLHYTTIANNTFYHTTQTMLYIEDGAGGTHIHDTTYVQNNIFDAYTDQYSAQSPTVGITYDHNNWYGGLSGHTIPGTGDITSDPLMVNPSAESAATDYKLQSTSPCINAGATVTAVPKDYWGTARPSGSAYDIGAHEY